MKYAKRLLLLLWLVPFLALLPVGTWADGGEDPPHGRPGFRDEAVTSRGSLPGSNGAPSEDGTREAIAGESEVNYRAALWSYLDRLLGDLL